MIHTQDFINLDDLHHEDFYTLNLLELLGAALNDRIKNFLTGLGMGTSPFIHNDAQVDSMARIEGRVYIDKGARIEPFSYIVGPAYIGPNTEVRQGAYIRGNVFVGKDCVVGHTTEVKGSVFCDHAKAGHFAYVGDSILGRNVNLGAGTKLANLKLNRSEVAYKLKGSQESLKSGLKKFGAILGDNAQTGCNSVLSPGTLLYPNTGVLPCVHFQGTLEKGFGR